MGVCGSVVLFYGRSVLRRPSGRLWLRRPLLSVFVSPSPLFGVLGQCSYLWTLMAPSSSSMGFSSSVLRLPKKPRIPPRARRNTAALPIPRQRYRFRTNASLEGVSGQRPHIWAFAAPSSSFKGVCASAHCGRLCLLFVAVAGLYVFGFGEKSPR